MRSPKKKKMENRRVAVCIIFLVFVLSGQLASGILELLRTLKPEKIILAMGILKEYDEMLLECQRANPGKTTIEEPTFRDISGNLMGSVLTEYYTKLLTFEMNCVIENQSNEKRWIIIILMKYFALKFSALAAFEFLTYFRGKIASESTISKSRAKKRSESYSFYGRSDNQVQTDALIARYLAIYGLNQDLALDDFFKKYWGDPLLEKSPYGNIKDTKDRFLKLENSVKNILQEMDSLYQKQSIFTTEGILAFYNVSVLDHIHYLDAFAERMIYACTGLSEQPPELDKNKMEEVQRTIFAVSKDISDMIQNGDYVSSCIRAIVKSHVREADKEVKNLIKTPTATLDLEVIRNADGKAGFLFSMSGDSESGSSSPAIASKNKNKKR